MPTQYLEYELNRCYIDHWLVTGPLTLNQVEPGNNPSWQSPPAESQDYPFDPDTSDSISEWDPPMSLNGQVLRWHYQRCTDDHWLDLSFTPATSSRAIKWAYIELVTAEAREVELRVAAYVPCQLWIAKTQCIRVASVSAKPFTTNARVRLQEGHSPLLVQMETSGYGPAPFILSVAVADDQTQPDAIKVAIPTGIENIARRHLLERVIQAAYLDRDLYRRDERIQVHWPPDMADSADITAQLRDENENIVCEGYHTAKSGSVLGLTKSIQNPSGHYHIVVFPTLKEYYEEQQRVTKRIDLDTQNELCSTWLNSSVEASRAEALENLVRLGDSPYAESAKMALGQWAQVNADALRASIARVNQHLPGSETALVDLLCLTLAFGEQPGFPQVVREELQECIALQAVVDFEPGSDSSNQLPRLASRVLAQQLFPQVGNIGSSATVTPVEATAMTFLERYGQEGFQHWGSGQGIAEDLACLVPLTRWAPGAGMRRLASDLVAKLLFELAVNSHLGILGSPCAQANVNHLTQPSLGPAPSLNRYLWGMGCYNHEMAAIAALVATSSFTPPAIIGHIARNMPPEMWSLERHAGTSPQEPSGPEPAWDVHKATYRTPDYLLSSIQDWHAGGTGASEHLWQATMGADALVFTNQPGALSENPAINPNFWCGNVSIPRIAQWKDTVIILYQLPAESRLGFTHAYFPFFAFDEYRIAGRWAFAQKGEAFLALACSQDLEVNRQGLGADRELRAHGAATAWICQMGRAELDDDFETFCNKVQALPQLIEATQVRYQTLRGDQLEFGWRNDLQINGLSHVLHDPHHYWNRYCKADWPADRMELTLGADKAVLNFTHQA